MSNLEREPHELVCTSGAATVTLPREARESGPLVEDPEILEPREVPLGGPRAMLVRRTLPHRDRRMVGAWCFVDHYGPDDVRTGDGMQVPPHPHTGLQTVSWLLEGEVLHRDSLGHTQLIRPGELNLMTAGRAISHAEESPVTRPPVLHGVQLWVALPGTVRRTDPQFAHHDDLPRAEVGGASATVVMGSFAGVRSPARTYTPLVGAELKLPAGARPSVPLDMSFEHGLLALSDGISVDGHPVPRGAMLVLDPGHPEVRVSAGQPGVVMLIGGEPFDEELVMWWNFVGRTHEEIVEMRSDWEAGRHFGVVHGYDGDPLAAPALPGTRLRARPRKRPPPMP